MAPAKKAKVEEHEETDAAPLIDEETIKVLLDIEEKMEKFDDERKNELQKLEHSYEVKKKDLYKERFDVLEKVPGHWSRCFEAMGLWSDSDEELKEYFTNYMYVVDEKDYHKAVFHFYFKENPFFTDKVLTKEITHADDNNMNYSSTSIKWKSGGKAKLIKTGDSKKRRAEDMFDIGFLNWLTFEGESTEYEHNDFTMRLVSLFQNGATEVYEDDSDDEDHEGCEDEEYEYLSESTLVVKQLQSLTAKQASFYVLADTTYGSCCVDEVAAEHVNADFIVHYGRACLSPTVRVPKQYVFGNQKVDEEHCCDSFTSVFGDDKDQPVVLMADVLFDYVLENIANKLRSEGFSKLQVANIHFPKTPTETPSRNYKLSDESRPETSIFYIGYQSLAQSNMILSHSTCKAFYSYNPFERKLTHESGSVNRTLMRRYFALQKAKDSSIIAIVVGTLGVATYKELIVGLKSLIRAKGKKPYVLAVGKPNPAKLGNFMEVDCFVLVACPENSLLDTKEFMKPIITPFELHLALSSKDEIWNPHTGNYITEFGSIVDQITADAAKLTEENTRKGSSNAGKTLDEMESDEEPEFSLVTGQYRAKDKYGLHSSGGVVSRTVETPNADGTVMVRNNLKELSTFVMGSAAAEYLNMNRSFKGLEIDPENSEPSMVVQGRSGIAKGYEGEDEF
ncbi:Diphthamide biosynthesis protein 2 [Nowakowskiella sp. JEL0407]|nr:Diphthamide biosynthesis protein 2 [Nowakowskiella sp. JEL0407]